MKVYAYVALAAIAVGGLTWAYNKTYAAGWNAAVVEQQNKINKAADEARRLEREKWANAVAAAQSQIRVEERIVEKTRDVEKRIPIVMETISVEKPDCVDLGADVVSVFNAQVDSGADTGTVRPRPPSNLDGVVFSNGALRVGSDRRDTSDARDQHGKREPVHR